MVAVLQLVAVVAVLLIGVLAVTSILISSLLEAVVAVATMAEAEVLMALVEEAEAEAQASWMIYAKPLIVVRPITTEVLEVQ
tara:strand:+ start:417 stop:662 length:246 start_codon:yes stop_codon:yes gene_type:complete